MISIPAFSSRKDKEIFLMKIIKTLSISNSEKDIYYLCIEVLDTTSFNNFFQKIILQINGTQKENIDFTTIEPFTAILI